MVGLGQYQNQGRREAVSQTTKQYYPREFWFLSPNTGESVRSFRCVGIGCTPLHNPPVCPSIFLSYSLTHSFLKKVLGDWDKSPPMGIFILCYKYIFIRYSFLLSITNWPTTNVTPDKLSWEQ